MVPGEGVEPSRCRQRRILSPLRLPFRHPGRVRAPTRQIASRGADRDYCRKPGTARTLRHPNLDRSERRSIAQHGFAAKRSPVGSPLAVEAVAYGALVMPPNVPDHWQYWFCPLTYEVKPLIVGVISLATNVPDVPSPHV